MEQLDITGARRMRADLQGELTPEQRKSVGIWLCKMSTNSDIWGISIHLAEGETVDTFLSKLPEERRENVRFYNPTLIENSSAA